MWSPKWHGKWLLLLVSLLGLTSLVKALEVLPGGFVKFSDQVIAKAAVPEGEQIRFRGMHQLYVSPDANGNFSLELQNRQVGKYDAKVTYRMFDLKANLIMQGDIDIHNTEVLTKQGMAPGVYVLEVNSSSNSVYVRNPSGLCFMEATTNRPLQLIEDCPKLFFLVSADSDEIKLQVKGQPSLEHVAVTVWDSDGKVVAEENTVGKPKHDCQIVLPVPINQRGKLWSLRMGKVEGYGYEDMALILLSGTETVVAMKPEQMALPLTQFVCTDVDKKLSRVGFDFNNRIREIDGVKARLEFDFQDGSRKEKLVEEWSAAQTLNSCYLDFDYNDLVLGTLKLELFDGQGNSRLVRSEKVAVCMGYGYQEIEWIEDHPAARVNDADNARGYQVFQREEPGDVRPNSRPRQKEIVREIVDTMAPGCWSVQFFALYPLRDAKAKKLLITDLELIGRQKARISHESIEFLTVRTWPQLTDWNAFTYHIIPEMMEQKDEVDLFAFEPQQFALRIPIPADAPPGEYRGFVYDGADRVAGVSVQVLPYQLPEVDGMTWGLYSDQIRWRIYSDDQVRHEMRLFREQGFNALMMYPLYDAVGTWENGALKVDFGRFRDYMQMYCEAGFKGVAVLSLQGVENFLRKSLGMKEIDYTADFRKAFNDLLSQLRKMGVDNHWPHYCLHTVDEPNARHGADEATRTLRFVKEAGFLTFNTCYGQFVRDVLDPWLDYRCYNNIGYGSTPNEKAAADLRAETLEAGDYFWQYATGCYTNSGLIEDGNIYSNRHLGGVLVWRSQFTGSYTWTLLRAKNDPYNDFDGWGHGERKEACTVYPTLDRKGIIPTLQWEGIREGIYDHRFLTVLDELIKKGLASNDRKLQHDAAQVSKSRDAIWDDMGWTCRNGAVTNEHLRKARKTVISLIEAMRKNEAIRQK